MNIQNMLASFLQVFSFLFFFGYVSSFNLKKQTKVKTKKFETYTYIGKAWREKEWSTSSHQQVLATPVL